MEQDDDDELLAVSYQGVTPGVPVLTKDGTQFGILEHVLEVPEEDLFDGLVVWTGAGGWLDRRIQRDLSSGRGIRELHGGFDAAAAVQQLRFVDADQAFGGDHLRLRPLRPGRGAGKRAAAARR